MQGEEACISEIAVRAALRGKRVAVAVAAAFVPLGEAYSLPTGENVVHGDVQVTRPTTQTMQINQGTQKGIVNWQGFSIGGSEHVNITQPNSAASLLNRVVGNDPSNIFGRLTANGQVFLVNNAGVFFAPGASVNAAALVASTLSITDQNFLDNIYQFYNPGNAGSVVNQGSIVTAGGFTALIGPQVRNDGVIIANSGKIALGAGNRVSLDLIGDGLVSISVDEAAFNASVINTGTLQADGGTVFLKASSANALLDTVINTSGVIRAVSLVERNGEIVLDAGPNGGIASSGEMQAGQVSISGGSLHLQKQLPDPMLLNGLISAIRSTSTSPGVFWSTAAGRSPAETGKASPPTRSPCERRPANSPPFATKAAIRRSPRPDQAASWWKVSTAAAPSSASPSVFGVPATDSQTISTTRINVQGGGIQANEQDISASADIRVAGGSIAAFSRQTIAASGGNIEVAASSPGFGASISSFGAQSITVSGGSNNAITVGAAGAQAISQIVGGSQTITAGIEGQQGSITIVGADAPASFVGIVSSFTPGRSEHPERFDEWRAFDPRRKLAVPAAGGHAAGAGVLGHRHFPKRERHADHPGGGGRPARRRWHQQQRVHQLQPGRQPEHHFRLRSP